MKQVSGHLRRTRAPLGGAPAQSKEAYVRKRARTVFWYIDHKEKYNDITYNDDLFCSTVRTF